jgi:hypothetical protein
MTVNQARQKSEAGAFLDLAREAGKLRLWRNAGDSPAIH